MKHLVVAAHPRIDSLTLNLAHAYVGELAAQGHQHTLYDLYRMEFCPTLTDVEMEQAAVGTAPPEVLQAQADVEAADCLTVVYPLWWLSMPAMLKGFIDRTFARGFAYESRHGRMRGLLHGRKCVLITLSGSPLWTMTHSGDWEAVKMLQDTHIFRSTGFELLEHLHFDHIVPGMPTTAVDRIFHQVRDCARKHFGHCVTAREEQTEEV